MVKVHECRRELFVGDCTRKATGEKRCKFNRQRRIFWCRGKRHWRPEQWQKGIFSDETQVVIGQNNSVSLWRKSS